MPIKTNGYQQHKPLDSSITSPSSRNDSSVISSSMGVSPNNKNMITKLNPNRVDTTSSDDDDDSSLSDDSSYITNNLSNSQSDTSSLKKSIPYAYK